MEAHPGRERHVGRIPPQIQVRAGEARLQFVILCIQIQKQMRQVKDMVGVTGIQGHIFQSDPGRRRQPAGECGTSGDMQIDHAMTYTDAQGLQAGGEQLQQGNADGKIGVCGTDTACPIRKGHVLRQHPGVAGPAPRKAAQMQRLQVQLGFDRGLKLRLDRRKIRRPPVKPCAGKNRGQQEQQGDALENRGDHFRPPALPPRLNLCPCPVS